MASGREAPTVAGVIVAAGSGQRLGADRPKALVELSGIPLVRRAVALFADAGLPPPIVVYPDDYRDAFVAAVAGLDVADFVAGGATRAQSVRAGLGVAGDVDVIVIHDAARALAPARILVEAVEAVASGAVAAAPGLPVADTLKAVDAGCIHRTVDREGLVGIQTPQVFSAPALRAALDVMATSDTTDAMTDEMAVMELAREWGVVDGELVVTTGSVFAHKLTTSDDLAVLNALAWVADAERG